MTAKAPGRISDLVMVLEIAHKGGWRQVEGRPAAAFLLPSVPLSLIEIAVLHRRNELLRRAAVIAVIGLMVAR